MVHWQPHKQEQSVASLPQFSSKDKLNSSHLLWAQTNQAELCTHFKKNTTLLLH